MLYYYYYYYMFFTESYHHRSRCLSPTNLADCTFDTLLHMLSALTLSLVCSSVARIVVTFDIGML